MNEQTIDVENGSVTVVTQTSGVTDGPPAAHTRGPLWNTQLKVLSDSRPTTEDDTPRSLSPYWEISIYTEEEINAIREADKLDPDLAEYYKDLLED